jgi:hypothetical protein
MTAAVSLAGIGHYYIILIGQVTQSVVLKIMKDQVGEGETN